MTHSFGDSTNYCTSVRLLHLVCDFKMVAINADCLATGPRILHFMIEYIKHANISKLQNRHIYIEHGVLVTRPNFGVNRSKT